MPIHKQKVKISTDNQKKNRRGAVNTVPQDVREKAVEMIVSGASRKEIADSLGLSTFQVGNIAKSERCIFSHGEIKPVRKQTLDLRKKELSDREICHILKLSENQIKAVNISTEKYGKDVLERNPDILEYLQQGYSPKKAAELSGKSVFEVNFVKYVLREKGITIIPWQEEAAVRMFKETPDIEKIAEELGLRPAIVFRYLGRNGLVEPMEKPLIGYRTLKDLNAHKKLNEKRIRERRMEIERNTVTSVPLEPEKKRRRGRAKKNPADTGNILPI